MLFFKFCFSLCLCVSVVRRGPSWLTLLRPDEDDRSVIMQAFAIREASHVSKNRFRARLGQKNVIPHALRAVFFVGQAGRFRNSITVENQTRTRRELHF